MTEHNNELINVDELKNAFKEGYALGWLDAEQSAYLDVEAIANEFIHTLLEKSLLSRNTG